MMLRAATLIILLTTHAHSAPFEDATQETIGQTGDWSNKVELADIDGDGTVDILFANGGNYASAGSPQLNTAFLNSQSGTFTEASIAIFETPDLARVIKARDLNADGIVDLVIGATYQTQSRLFLGLGEGNFVEVTNTHLPSQVGSFGDLAIGDVDADGDLDLVLADWGPGNPLNNEGGVTRLWLNNGFGAFSDATADKMPDVQVRFSWELELVDVDNDWDLDILISCKSCTGSKLFHNTGTGDFIDASDVLPQFTNNYDFEAMDMNGDGFLDLVTINDGPGLREHILIANGEGGYEDATDTLWPNSANVGEDDNMVAFLDYDSDGDADFLIGSLSGEDRLLLNDGSGSLVLQSPIFDGASTPGTLGIALADLNDDARLDVVHAQGEVATAEKVFLGTDIPVDTAPPTIANTKAIALESGGVRIHARVHDRKTPVMPHDFTTIEVQWSVQGGDTQSTPLRWMGEYIFTADGAAGLGGMLTWKVCATDHAGNNQCSLDDVVDMQGRDAPGQPDTDSEDEDISPPATDDEDQRTDNDADAERVAEPETVPDASEPDATTRLPDDISLTPDSESRRSANAVATSDSGCSSTAYGAGPPLTSWHIMLFGYTLFLLRIRRRQAHSSKFFDRDC
ncbi:MAG: VCBS repeat-containing protein [Myxococcota bacterium]|nr:VCBS repeat-containing protein [Myxococcota bacterium]